MNYEKGMMLYAQSKNAGRMANVRTGAGTEYTSIGVVPINPVMVEYLDYQDGWHCLRFNRRSSGWVHDSAIKLEPVEDSIPVNPSEFVHFPDVEFYIGNLGDGQREFVAKTFDWIANVMHELANRVREDEV